MADVKSFDIFGYGNKMWSYVYNKFVCKCSSLCLCTNVLLNILLMIINVTLTKTIQ